MKSIRRILVVIDPTSDEQPAFESALALAAACGSSLELFACEFRDVHVRYHPIEIATAQQFHDLVLKQLESKLEALAVRAQEKGIAARIETAWAAPYYEEIIARASADEIDLVVKATRYHGKLRRTLFTGSDWHLIRDCPAPLLLVKKPEWPQEPLVVAALDPLHAHDKPAMLDQQLIETALLIGSAMHGKVEALHVHAAPGPLEVAGEAAAVSTLTATPLPEAPTREDVEKALADLLASYPIPRQSQHVRSGRPAEGIIEFANERHPDLIVMGAVSRSRLERLFVGNTAESVLDELPCNVLVEKPAAR